MSSNTNKSNKWIQLPEAEQKEFLKNRNAEYSRKSRQKWKESDEEMRILYESNEKKIKHLENMVNSLSKKIQHSSISSSSSSTKHTKPNKNGSG